MASVRTEDERRSEYFTIILSLKLIFIIFYPMNRFLSEILDSFLVFFRIDLG